MAPASGHRDYRQPPERKSMHARIVRDLGMRIVSGEFEPGDRLPGEASLMADYDVSRQVPVSYTHLTLPTTERV